LGIWADFGLLKMLKISKNFIQIISAYRTARKMPHTVTKNSLAPSL
jgi:hypothetical protein